MPIVDFALRLGTAQIKSLGRQDEALEQLVVRLSLESGVSAVSWTVHPQGLE